MFPDAGRTPHELFDRSDYALYNSKQEKRGTVTLYSANHEARIRSERAIENALTNADLEAEMEIVLQPIFRLSDESIVAFEALARWRSPSMGSIPPDRFIPIAERSGMIHRLTLILFAKSIQSLSGMPDHIGLSFNLSANDITSDRTVLSLITAIRQSRIDPKRITFEITETAVVRNYDHAEKSMRLLRTFGSSLALDDFGTGYSSLGYLHRLPIDRVKVDRSFVSDLPRTGNSIVGSILALCEKMDMECIVEGVEEETQLRALRLLGCQYAQGFLLGRPMSVEDARHCVRMEQDQGKTVAL
jgi:predicted signal transduction protein with EAL and GGDEF domain